MQSHVWLLYRTSPSLNINVPYSKSYLQETFAESFSVYLLVLLGLLLDLLLGHSLNKDDVGVQILSIFQLIVTPKFKESPTSLIVIR